VAIFPRVLPEVRGWASDLAKPDVKNRYAIILTAIPNSTAAFQDRVLRTVVDGRIIVRVFCDHRYYREKLLRAQLSISLNIVRGRADGKHRASSTRIETKRVRHNRRCALASTMPRNKNQTY
jgi:hypothetical protein